MIMIRNNWKISEIKSLFALPFNDLLFEAQSLHRVYFDPNEVQVSQLLSIKTGACPEDCKYCPQSARYNTDLETEKLLEIEKVVQEAKKAKATGATRFCMGAAWRNPKERDLPYLVELIQQVKALGLETCMTLGMLNQEQAYTLSNAGLDYYNHNLDTSEQFYSDIITTRSYQDRLDTLDNVRKSGMKVCSGGIVGLGESMDDICSMIQQFANMDKHPESVPINMLVKVKGTPLYDNKDVDPIDFVKTIAVCRITMPESHVRLSAGRQQMSEEVQALCFFAGANSIFYGDRLLTTENPTEHQDIQLFAKLGINSQLVNTFSEQMMFPVETNNVEMYYNAAP